jgi:hypothetical protein
LKCRAIRLIIAGLVVLVTLWLVFYLSGPRLELYTSPALRLDGKTVRLQVLIPAGWTGVEPTDYTGTMIGIKHFDEVQPFMSRSARARFGPDRTVRLITVGPKHDRRRWLPRWLHERLYGKEAERGAATLCFGFNYAEQNDEVVRTNLTFGSEPPLAVAARGTDRDPPCSVVYASKNQTCFSATYRQICESFRVLR